LKVTGGAGEDDDPWEMEWSPESGGGGNLGNVIYDGNRLSVDNGTGATVITNINYTNAPLTIQNDGGGLTFNAVTDSTTVRGDNLLELRSSDGIVQIDADTDVNINATNNINIESLLGNVSIASNDDIDIDASFGNVTLKMGSQANPSTGIYYNDSYKNTPGDLIAWRNRDSNNDLIGGFKMSRDSDGNELLICDSISTFSFAGNTSAIATSINPIIRFNQLPNIPCSLRFDNAPQAIGNILTVTGGNGGTGSPYELNWQAPASGGGGDGNVTSDFLTDRLTRDDGTGTQVIIDTIDQGDNAFTIKNYGENEINMTREREFGQPNEKATIELKSFGDAFENRILLNTFTTASTGTSLLMTSSDDVSQPNSIRFTTSNIIQDSISPYFQVDGSPSGTNARRRFQLSDKEAYFGSFRVLNFSATNTGQSTFNPSYKWNGANFYRWDNTPVPSQGVLNSVLTVTSGNGLEASPFSMNWVNAPTGGGALNTLDITYDQTNSVLVLSDPVDGVISTTTVVPGRTVLVEDVTVNGTTELSALGLSNSIFPPPLQGQPGYFDGLIGNSPPRVSLNPATGLTNWFKGASFRATLSGEIVNIGGYDDIILRVYSNRGQASQNILNSFRMVTRSVSPPPKVGFKWTIDFTCRSVNDGGILGVLATSSQFDYTDDTYVLETLGAIVNNTNSSFDTSVEQFLDFTIEFDYYNNSNNIKTTLATIERIF
jgi:hypothetical protein